MYPTDGIIKVSIESIAEDRDYLGGLEHYVLLLSERSLELNIHKIKWIILEYCETDEGLRIFLVGLDKKEVLK